MLTNSHKRDKIRILEGCFMAYKKYKYIGTREMKCPECGHTVFNVFLGYDQDGNLIEEAGGCKKHGCPQSIYTRPITDESEVEPGVIPSEPPSKSIPEKTDPFKPTVKCPYCGSTSTKKISTLSRLGSFATFGFAGKKVGKQWHCNNCKSDF